MTQTIANALKEYGFSEKETQLYLANLELGSATANDISKKAQLNRSTTYDILKIFLEKGYSSKAIRNQTNYYDVVSPEIFISKLDEKKAQILEVMQELKAISMRTIVKPKVEVYEGKEGLKTILQEILNTNKEMDVISTSRIFKVLMYSFPRYILERKEKGIFARVIQEKSNETNKLKNKDKEELRKTKGIENFELNSATFIFGDNTAIIKLVENEPIGIIIHDKMITNDQKKIFEIIWNQATT